MFPNISANDVLFSICIVVVSIIISMFLSKREKELVGMIGIDISGDLKKLNPKLTCDIVKIDASFLYSYTLELKKIPGFEIEEFIVFTGFDARCVECRRTNFFSFNEDDDLIYYRLVVETVHLSDFIAKMGSIYIKTSAGIIRNKGFVSNSRDYDVEEIFSLFKKGRSLRMVPIPSSSI